MINFIDFNILSLFSLAIPLIGGFIDSTSAAVDAVLTRKGKELLARNDGSFKIAKFAFGDDEINYQLYNINTDDDSSILNLPILEPSSNENAALRYRLITLPKGSIAIATLLVLPDYIQLASPDIGSGITRAMIVVQSFGGTDNTYTVISRNTNLVKANITGQGAVLDANSEVKSTAVVMVEAVGRDGGQTIVDVIGNDTGAAATIVVSVWSDRSLK